MATGRKNAVITTTAFEVGCGFCGEPQPSPETGSHIWTSDELAKEVSEGRSLRTCDACDKPVLLTAPQRCTVVYFARA